jgi:uncharacterized protein (DUF362 family)
MILRIQQVKTYGDRQTIDSFVHEIVEHQWSIMGWNRLPLNPSRLIVVKPNWIQDSHEYFPDLWEPVITHPNLVLSVVEALAKQMGGCGTIVICDAPNTYADFSKIAGRGGLKVGLEAIQSKWPKLHLDLLDLRREIWLIREQVVIQRRRNDPDPRGYVKLNLGVDSLFSGYCGEGRYYGADYDSSVVNEHHCRATQEYLIAGTPMDCDLFVNVPKLKTHKKTGLTCSLKNLVGINGDKNWLPHFTEGSPKTGGDEFQDESLAHVIESHFKKTGRRMALSMPHLGTWIFRKIRNVGKTFLRDSETVVRNGNWRGNDTCWRMVLDLNRALLYGRTDGTWSEVSQSRNYLSIVDGITGGEGNGPLSPDPVKSGVILAGTSAAELDAVACMLMSFDPHKIPLVREAFSPHRWPLANKKLDEVKVDDRRVGRVIPLKQVEPAVPGGFKPHFGWMNLRSEP